jgi:hypothetical protein
MDEDDLDEELLAAVGRKRPQEDELGALMCMRTAIFVPWTRVHANVRYIAIAQVRRKMLVLHISNSRQFIAQSTFCLLMVTITNSANARSDDVCS